MKKIELSFRWVDLDDESKRNLMSILKELHEGNTPSFEQLDRGLTAVDCEFVMSLNKGRPSIGLSDRTRAVIFQQMFN